jgi:hypothetical protein
MKQKELLQKIEEKPKDDSNQISLIKKITLNVNLKLIRQLGAKMKYYYLNIILIFFYINTGHALDNLTIPNSFSTGEVVSSSKINANFDAIKTNVNQLNSSINKSLIFPDGDWGNPITKLADGSYTVPNGKTFYLLSFEGKLEFNGVEYIKTNNSKYGEVIANPVIIKENTTLSGGSWMTGFEVDKGVEVVNEEITDSIGYTVPGGKTLIILTTDQLAAYYGGLTLNSQQLFGLDQDNIFHLPIIVTENNIIYANQSGTYRTRFTGYLKNN